MKSCCGDVFYWFVRLDFCQLIDVRKGFFSQKNSLGCQLSVFMSWRHLLQNNGESPELSEDGKKMRVWRLTTI
jgi:hypothetical protein